MKSILGSGLIAVDHIFLVEKRRRSFKKSEYLGSAGGGSIPNMLCLLSLLGYKTHIFGVIGNDLGARIVKEDFRLFGVNCNSLVERGNKNDLRFTRQFSHIIFSDGTHRFKNCCLDCDSKFGREYQISKSDVEQKIEKLASKTSLLLLDRANKATFSLAQIAKKHGIKIAYDLSFGSYGDYLKTTNDILKLCDLVKINHKTFKKIMGSHDNLAVMRWRERYPDINYLLITNGENGVSGYAKINNEKQIFQFNAIHCDRAIDSAGAGDVFFGVAISQLLLKKPPENLKDFRRKINLGQALASLNCTLYGARALQRTFLNQKVSSKEILDSADFIRERKRSGNSFSPKIGLPKPISEPYRLARLNGCKICGSIPKDKRRKRFLKSKVTSQVKRGRIHESLTRAPWTMKSSFEIGKMYRNGILELTSNNALIVGSGGSFTASVFGEVLYFQALGKLAKAITPFEFEGLKRIDKNTVVWFVSHGGGNTDILGAALNAKKMGHSKCIVLTGNKNSKLADLARQNRWKTLFIQSHERNFVSIIGLLSQVSALCGLLVTNDEIEKLDEFFSDIHLRTHFNSSMREMRLIANEIAKSHDMIKNIHLVSFARGWGWPALVDLESKITEGGICTIEVSEMKNYTHGRYMNLFGHSNRRIILIKTPKDVELVDFLSRRFQKYIPTFTLQTDENSIVGALDLLIKVLFLSWYLGQIAKKDILKPKYPSQARGLYSWEPSYRKDFWNDRRNPKKKTSDTSIRLN